MAKKFSLPNLEQTLSSMADVTKPTTNLATSQVAKTSEVSTVTVQESTQKVLDIPITLLNDNPKNGRRKYKPEEIERLAESISDAGFSGVVEVITSPDRAGEYQLIYGHKRKRGALLAGKTTMPCIIVKEEALITRKKSFYENFVRSDISKIEQAIELQALKDDFDDITNVELSKMTGMSQSDVSRFFKLLTLPETVQQAIDEGSLSFGHASDLIPLIGKSENDSLVIDAALRTVKYEWSVKELRRFLKSTADKKDEDRAGELPKNELVSKMEEDLKLKFKSSVTIRASKNKGGKIVLPYASAEDLKRLFEILNSQ